MTARKSNRGKQQPVTDKEQKDAGESFDVPDRRALNVRRNGHARSTRCAADGRPSTSRSTSLLVKLKHDAELRRDVTESDIIGIDGMGSWGARMLGVAVSERVAGVDLMERLLAICAAEGFRPYSSARGRRCLSAPWSRRGAAGRACSSPMPQRLLDPDEEAAWRARPAQPRRLPVHRHADPRKERFLHAHREALGAVRRGVGGGIDVLAGAVCRAPRPRSAPARMALPHLPEPRCMWWRYVSTNAESPLMGRALVGRAWRRTAPARAALTGRRSR